MVDEEGDDEASPRDPEGPRPSLSELAKSLRERSHHQPDQESFDAEGAYQWAVSSEEASTPASLDDLVDAVEDRGSRHAWAAVSGGESRPLGSDPKGQAILDMVGDVANILLLGPLLCPADYDLCSKLLTGEEQETPLLLVTLSQSPDERLNGLRSYLRGDPQEIVVLDVGDPVGSGSRTTTSLEGEASVTVESVPDPTDLMRIGITISRYLSEWNREGAEPVVCFHSITGLLQFVEDRKSAFRFLHVLQSHVTATGARAHYHMDTGAHGEDVIGTFRPLFDVVLTFEENGSVSIDR